MRLVQKQLLGRDSARGIEGVLLLSRTSKVLGHIDISGRSGHGSTSADLAASLASASQAAERERTQFGPHLFANEHSGWSGDKVTTHPLLPIPPHPPKHPAR